MQYELYNGQVHFEIDTLSPSNYIANQKSLLIMKMTGCRYCENLTETLSSTVFKDYLINYLDEIDPENQKLCQKWNVKSYPTIFVVDGNGKMNIRNPYEGQRDQKSLLKLFV